MEMTFTDLPMMQPSTVSKLKALFMASKPEDSGSSFMMSSLFRGSRDEENNLRFCCMAT